MTPNATEQVTAPVIDDLTIPDFLLRNPDNSFKYPGVSNGLTAASGASDGNLVNERQTVSPPMSGNDEQQAFVEHQKVKARGHRERLKSQKADRDAMKAGKKWDAQRGGWK